MTTPPDHHDASTERASALRRHLAPMYRFAQVLTEDAAGATACVEETCRRALRQPASEQLSRARLFQLLLATCAQKDPDAGAAPASALGALHRKLALDYLRRALPHAFLTLPGQQQLLLLLVATERFSPADAGRILDLPAERARAERAAAHGTLRDRLLDPASPDERALLAPHLSEEALNQTIGEQLAAPPSSVPASLQRAIANLPVEERTPDAALERSPIPQESSPAPNSPSRRTSRLLTVLLLVVALGTVSLLAVRFLQHRDTSKRLDLVAYTARQAPSVEPILHTRNARAAEGFIHEEVGRRLAVPAIDSARLSGVGLRSLGGARVPVLLYDDQATGSTLPVYAYTYAVLDRLGKQFDFSEKALARIQQDGGSVVQQTRGRGVLIWRNRDDIFLAVVPGTAGSLRQRVATSNGE